MEDLNNVPSTGTFGNSINQVNQNFGLVKGAIENVEGRTIRSKGLFPTQAALTAAYPSPKVGDYAYVGSGLPATIYDCLVAGTWHNTGQTGGSETVDLNNYSTKSETSASVANSLAQATARMGYGVATASNNAYSVTIANYTLPTNGGVVRVKMPTAATGAATLNITNTGAKTLWYNGKAVSSTNTWEAEEIISVFYDGTKYMASNSQGGGGNASKIKYDNSQSGLNVNETNVQDAIDGLSDQIERESVLRYETLAYSAVTGYDCYITGDNVLYDTTNLTSTRKVRCVTVYTTNYSCIEITANSNGCYYAFLKSFTPPEVGETDEQPDFCEGYESRYLIDGEQKKLLFLPQDCNILYIYDGSQTAWRPTLVRVGFGTAKTVSINKTAIDNLQIKLSMQQEVDYADMTGVDGYLADNGGFVNTSSVTPMPTRRRSVPIPVDGCLSFSYIANTNGIKYAFLTSRNFTHKQRADFVEGYEYVIIDTDNDGTLKYVPIPYGCKYLYVYDGTIAEGRNYRPQYISRGYPISSSSESISADLNEVKKLIANAQKGNSIDNNGRVYPDDITVLNVERRASQRLDVQWTALSTIASTTSNTGISAGSHTGLPYTSCMEVDKFVGYDVTLLTFMTAANNPYSLLYTEDLKIRTSGGHGTSGYGFTYHGTRATIGGYMGIVCNIFAIGSIGMEIPFDTGMFAWLAEQGIFTKIYDQSAQGVRIGDIIWEPGHGNVITDMWRNQRGEVTYIDWSESIANFPRTTHMTPTQFDNRLAQNTGIIYRYNELYKNIKYTPSPFVAVEGETSQTYVYNDDICTFAGDYACFRVGFPIYINYNLKSVGTWTTMQLYKDNSLLNTYNLDTSSHRLSLGSSLAAGKYKARLANGSTYSDYTYFEVVQTNATYANVGEDVKRVTFGSSNGTPMYVRCSGVDGAPMCLYPLTDEDIANGYCEVNFKSLIQKQYNNLASHTGNVYCKVTFKGDYGRVTNEPILSDL